MSTIDFPFILPFAEEAGFFVSNDDCIFDVSTGSCEVLNEPLLTFAKLIEENLLNTTAVLAWGIFNSSGQLVNTVYSEFNATDHVKMGWDVRPLSAGAPLKA